LGFRKKSENELASLDDDELFNYIKQARRAGEDGAMETAIGILAFRREGNIFGRIRLKVGDIEDARDLTQEVLLNAMKVKFKGDYIGELGSLIKVITNRRIADYHAKNNLDTDPLAEENSDEEDFLGEFVSEGDFTAHSETLAVYCQELERLNERHRMVVEYCVKGYSAKEVADEVNSVFVDEKTAMTNSNVDQIFKRFRDTLREAPGMEG